MGLLDQLTGQLGSLGQGQTGSGNIAQAVFGLLQNHPGGLAGLIDTCKQAGLGAQVASWVGTSANQPIDADHIRKILDNPTIAAFAAKLGISPDEAASKLAVLLPQAIDHLTPNGQVPASGSLLAEGESLLGGLFGHKTA